jgi:hypothetical protein
MVIDGAFFDDDARCHHGVADLIKHHSRDRGAWRRLRPCDQRQDDEQADR